MLPTMTNEDVCVVEKSLEEVPETVADEHEQAIPAYVNNEEEEDEIISLAQQPEVVEEAARDARVFGGRREGDISGRVVERVQHAFSFSPPKRDRKLSDEEQQEAKRPKSPAKEDVQQTEQHGSGGECGDKMETETVVRFAGYPVVGFGFGSSSTGPLSYPGLGSARRQQHFK